MRKLSSLAAISAASILFSSVSAAQTGDIELARAALEAGADVDTREENYHYTALFYAAAHQDIDMMELLLNHRANIDAVDGYGWTPLMNAVHEFWGEGEIAKFLIRKGADVNYADTDGDTALSVSIIHPTEFFRFLISNGAEVDAKDNDGETSLHNAAMIGQPDKLKLLIDAGADLNPGLDWKGFTVLIEAIHESSLGDDFSTGGYIPSPGHVECIALLVSAGTDLEERDKDGGTALMKAVWQGKLDTIQLLVENGADPNARDNSGQTALTNVNLGIDHPLSFEIMEYLIANGANVNLTRYDGTSPLSKYARLGYLAHLRFLLENGADPDIRDEHGRTALWWAKTQEIETLLRKIEVRE